MGIDVVTLAAAKAYTAATAAGMGAVKGKDGKDGDSAYQIAVKNGFVGTEQQWLDSLKNEGEMKLIERIDIGGLTALVRDTEPDGTPYNFKDFVIRCFLKAGSGSPNMYVNNNTMTYYPGNATADRYSTTRVMSINGALMGFSANAVSGWSYQANLAITPMGLFLPDGPKYVNRVHLTISSTSEITEGSYIEIYGVRA